MVKDASTIVPSEVLATPPDVNKPAAAAQPAAANGAAGSRLANAGKLGRAASFLLRLGKKKNK